MASPTVSVEDQCGGIPEPDLERVFDVAFRGDAARSPGDQGGGLGLAIAKGLVEACAGTIVVDNAADGLPVHGAAPAVGVSRRRHAGPRRSIDRP